MSRSIVAMPTLLQERFQAYPLETSKPKYEQLKSFFLAELKSGRLKPGDSLPSEPKLATALKVARSTVRQAFGELEHEGVIERLQGQGTYIRKAEAIGRTVPKGADNFAIIVPETLGGTIYSPLMNGFEKACNQIHKEMVVRSTNNSPIWQADAILALLDKRIGGIAMVPASSQPTPPHQVRHLQEQGVPVVFCHRSVEGITAPTLKIDFNQVGRLAGRQLLERGHKRISYLALTPSGEQARSGCEQGLREVLRENGVELEQAFSYTPPVGVELPIANYAESVGQWLEAMLARRDRPTAIFTSFDPLAELILSLLWERGVRVPKEMSLLSFGPSWRETLISRKLSVIAIDSVRIGQKACELLIEMQSGDRPIDEDVQIKVPLEFLEGETLGTIKPGI